MKQHEFITFNGSLIFLRRIRRKWKSSLPVKGLVAYSLVRR
jgi:hypothetical protein